MKTGNTYVQQARWRLLAVAVVIAVWAMCGTAIAAPDSTPEPGVAEVDGFISDWDTGLTEPPGTIATTWPSAGAWADSGDSSKSWSYFADMYRAGRPDLGKPVESRVWLRYNCRTATSGTLYALVLAAPGVYIQSSGDQFIKDGINRMLVNSGYSADGAEIGRAHV